MPQSLPRLTSVLCFGTLALTGCGGPLSGPRSLDSALNAGPRQIQGTVADTAAPEVGMAQAREATGDTDAEIEAYDPWEGWNTKAFDFNRRVDRYVLRPVAKGYNFLLPDEISGSTCFAASPIGRSFWITFRMRC